MFEAGVLQLQPARDHTLVCCLHDFASALKIDDKQRATVSPDVIAISVGYLQNCTPCELNF